MAKNIILGTVNDDFISTLSEYCGNMRKVSAIRKEAKEEIKQIEEEKEATLVKREELLKAGKSFDEAMEGTSIAEFNARINAINERVKAECLPFAKARKELLKGLEIGDLYDAYVVGVAKADFSAIGSVTKSGKNKDSIIVTKTSFNTQFGEWFADKGIKNADNLKAIDKFVTRCVIPFIGVKLDKATASNQAYSKSQFSDHFLVSVKEALVKVNFLEESVEGTLSRKNK